MLKTEEIQKLIDDDFASEKKKRAKKGQKYYEGEHDIKDYRLFYYNADGKLVEDTTRSNVKIPHPFFTELVDQAVQYMFSGDGRIMKSDIPELQTELDAYFNENEDFMAELSDAVAGCMAKGFEYMYAYKNPEDKISFQCADSLGVIEVQEKDSDDGCPYVIYWYFEKNEKNKQKIKHIQVWSKEDTYFYIQNGDGGVQEDSSEEINPKPHTLYQKEGDGAIYYGAHGFIPFFRMDNNKKQTSSLRPIKPLIDDYDIMASSLSNNLIDFDTPIHVVKGFQGDNLEELQQNLKTKKIVGVDENGGIETATIDVPYQARKEKLEIDEKNIYRFGMGLNIAGLKDTSATTNIAIKAAYSLLDLKCFKLEIRLKQFLRKIIKVVIREINENNGTDYQEKDVYIEFIHEIMSNAQENAQNELTEAQRRQTEINTLLDLSAQLDDETLMKLICEQLDIKYEDIKEKLPQNEEESAGQSKQMLESIVPDDESGGAGEQKAD